MSPRRRPLAAAAVALLAALGAAFVVALLHRPGEAPRSHRARPVSATLSLGPRDPQFGDTVVASADVTVDPGRVDPATVAVRTSFAPYRVVAATRTVGESGGLATVRVERRLRCLARACVPPGSRRTLRFPPLRVSYREGRAPRTLVRAWPAVHVHSRVAATDLRAPVLRVPAPPQPAAGFRLPPRPTGYALLALAALAAAAGAWLLLRAALRRAAPRRPEAPPLERLLRELAAAAAGGDAGRRRVALEALARELEPLHPSLSAESRVLAWAPPEPRAEAISELTSRVLAVTTP